MSSPETIRSFDRHVLIIDAMNLFTRCYVVNPTMNTDGEQIGGSIGFIKTLQKLVSEQQPSVVYVAWEGGGSQRRRKIYSDYKMNRKPEKLNRFYEDDIPDTDDNKKNQIFKLLAFLKTLPVCQLYVSDCEADDVIAYLCRGTLRETDKTIASSDKDFYQLLDDKTKVYSLHSKTYITKDDVFEKYRVTSSNFAIAKALCGDASDNIPGVKGMGFKTLAKHYPFLGLEPGVILQDVFDYAAAHRDESKSFSRVVENESDVRRNWDLVYLDGSMMSHHQTSQIDHQMNTFVPKSNKLEFIKLLVKEGLGDFPVDSLFYALGSLNNVSSK